MKLISLLICEVILTLTCAHNFEDCLKGKGSVVMLNMDIYPDPAIMGEVNSVNYTYRQSKRIDYGDCIRTAYLSVIPLLKLTADFCEGGICPQEPGTYNGSKVQFWCTSFNMSVVKK
ncbi:MAG: hypothetical protein EZS28_047766 [Streblomastix strix]|uniref:MD-2-related lipid-recognition domain-containing protein n=1 Tax=Streblomastix strix TaxID=222440 RepID=A0A5J4TEX7_9EUKA|nr:MAG: hypothetical protein EZS28_047766 [Streblomastix strix]